MRVRELVVMWIIVGVATACGLFPPWLEETNYRIEGTAPLIEAASVSPPGHPKTILELAYEFDPENPGNLPPREFIPNEAHFTRPLGCAFILDPPKPRYTRIGGLTGALSGVRVDSLRLLIQLMLIAFVGVAAWLSVRVQNSAR